MEWEELQDAIDENEAIVNESTQTTPDIIKRKKRLAELEAAQKALAAQAMGPPPAGPGSGRRPRRRGKAKEMPPKPETLARGQSIDYSKRSAGDITRELNLVVRYLAAGPSNDERQILEAELPYLEEAAGKARTAKRETKRSEQLENALKSSKGSEVKQLEELLSRVQNAEQDRTYKGIYRIYHGGKVFQLDEGELAGISKQIAKTLASRAKAINGYTIEIEDAWKNRAATNRRHEVVHAIASFRTDVTDITAAQIRRMSDDAQYYTGKVVREGIAGQLVKAGDDLIILKNIVGYWAEKVGKWESDLVSNAGMVAFGLQIAQILLTALAGFGAARLATAGGGGFLTTLKAGAKISTMTTGTGIGVGAISSAVAGRDWKKGARIGGGVGVGIGMNALTAGSGQIASIRDAAKVTGLARKGWAVGKAVGLETGLNLGGGLLQAGVEGSSLKNAAVSSVIATPLNVLGGGLADRFTPSLLPNTLIKGGLGSGGGALGAWATGGDVGMGALAGGASPLLAGADSYLTPPTALTSGDGSPAALPSPALDVGDSTGPPAGSPAPIVSGALSGAPGAGLPTSGLGAPGAPGGPSQEVAGGGRLGPAAAAGDDIDAAFANVGNVEQGEYVRASPGALKDPRPQAGGAEMDLGGISDVSVHHGAAPLQPGDPARPTTAAKAPPETWLVDPARANLTDPVSIADTDFKPNRTRFDYDVRNVQVRAGQRGGSISTPTGPEFAGNRVVGGARGATLDSGSGRWTPGLTAPHRAYNPLGQDAPFQERPAADWHAIEQHHGPLTDEQRYALWFYSDDLSGQINPALRGGKAQEFVRDPLAVAAVAGDLDKTMQPVPFDTVVHRRASIADFSDLGIKDPAELPAMAGKSYAHQGYTSTAIEPGHWSGDVDIVIEVPKGTRGRYLGGQGASDPATNPLKPSPGAPKASMPGEMEFLIERGTTFAIRNAQQDPQTGRWRVEVRVAEQGIKPKPLTNPVPLPGVAGLGSTGNGGAPRGGSGGAGGRAAKTTIPGTFPPRRPGPDPTIPGTFPARLPGPTPVSRAEIHLTSVRRDLAAAKARAQAALDAASAASGVSDGGHARVMLEVANLRLDEVRARRALAEARLAAAQAAGQPTNELAMEIAIANSDEGYRLFDIGQAQNQVVRAQRVDEGLQDGRARALRPGKASNE